MSMQTGENQQALRNILDITRLISMLLLGIHFYYYTYAAFKQWQLYSKLSDLVLYHIANTGLFASFHISKLLALGLLLVSLLGIQGRKDEKLKFATVRNTFIVGLVLYFGSALTLALPIEIKTIAICYLSLCCLGYLLILRAGTLLSRMILYKLNEQDIFNEENETFPQEERLLENEYSINLPATYRLKDSHRKSWINIVNPFRGLMVLGSPGSGKTYYIIRQLITQHISKGFSMMIYDFKFDDLSKIAYNAYLRRRQHQAVALAFYVINFDKLSCSNRCNPLEPLTMTDITDAFESARNILLGLNRTWIKRQGDFFVESPINFLAAMIWYLKKHQKGKYCTLPHLIELLQTDYDILFSLLRTQKEIEPLINPFLNAYLNDVMEQLEGQLASVKIALAQLASPQLYYILSGNDFSLDINNPIAPKILCLGSNPQKIQTYGAVLSLYVGRLIKQVNQKNKLKCSLIFDEFPTIYLNHIDHLIATARSNKVASCLAIQDFSQLRKDYGREQADVIINIAGNFISGQLSGDTARLLSERFGKIKQDRESLSINSSETTVSRSKQLDAAVPASKITTLSAGEFVGMVADDPDCIIKLKTFHCRILNDPNAIKKEELVNVELPELRKVDDALIQENYLQIKQEVQILIQTEMERLLNDPELSYMIVKKT